MDSIGKRITDLLSQMGYTQKELAKMAGVTEATMSRIICENRTPKMEVIANLATALNTTTDYLILGTEPKEDFSEIHRLVARSAKTMTDKEKMELIRVLTK